MNEITLEQLRDHFKREYLKLIDYFGDEKHPEKIEACKIVLDLIEKAIPKEPRAFGPADRYCPACGAWIKYDALNVPISSAPGRCTECGQIFEWKNKEGKHAEH